MTRPKEIPESSELCKDQIADNLLGFYAQVESFHNECLIGAPLRRFSAVDSPLRDSTRRLSFLALCRAARAARARRAPLGAPAAARVQAAAG